MPGTEGWRGCRPIIKYHRNHRKHPGASNRLGLTGTVSWVLLYRIQMVMLNKPISVKIYLIKYHRIHISSNGGALVPGQINTDKLGFKRGGVLEVGDIM